MQDQKNSCPAVNEMLACLLAAIAGLLLGVVVRVHSQAGLNNVGTEGFGHYTGLVSQSFVEFVALVHGTHVCCVSHCVCVHTLCALCACV